MHSENVHLVLIAAVIEFCDLYADILTLPFGIPCNECICLHQLQQPSTARYIILETSHRVK